jgi:hypothetical protein
MILAAVRLALGLKPGDRIAFVVEGWTAPIWKAKPRLDEGLAWERTQLRTMRD